MNSILQKGVFKPNYIQFKQYKLNNSFILSYVRRSYYTPSTISREMKEDYDRASIHMASPAS